jgi:hypothetical protein
MRMKTLLLTLPLCALTSAPLAAQTTLHLYAFEGEQVDAIIDWGSPEANADCQRVVQGAGESVTCALTSPGDRIRIAGTVPQFGPGAAGETGNTVARVLSWGSVDLKSLDGAFKGVASLVEVPASLPDTVVNLNRAFQNASNFAQDLRTWGMSLRNVRDAVDLFDGATSQTTDMSEWCLREISVPPAGMLGRTGLRAPALVGSAQKAPRFGSCGVSFVASNPANATTGESFTFNPVAEAWANKPGTAVFEAVGLPAGLSINPQTGVISGTPTTPGTSTVTVRLVDSAS